MLADQPVIADGIRSIYSIDLGAFEPGARAPALDRAARTIRIRLQLAGIPAHVAVDHDQLVVDLPGLAPEVIARAGDLLRPIGAVDLQFVEPGSAFMKALAEQVKADPVADGARITSRLDEWATPAGKHLTSWTLEAFDRVQDFTLDEARARGCYRGSAAGANVSCPVSGCSAIRTYVEALAARDPRFAVPDGRLLACEPHQRTSDRPQDPSRGYLVERDADHIGASIKRATARRDPYTERPEVQVELGKTGAQALAAATQRHTGDKLAISLDGRVMCAPIIAEPLTTGRVSISFADRADDDARDLAIVLTSGALPGPMLLEVRARLVGGVPQGEPQ